MVKNCQKKIVTKWKANEINDPEICKDTSWLENKFTEVFNLFPNIHKQKLNLRDGDTDEIRRET